ncbi:MAG: hypothetical protein ACYS4W_02910, partial [Planctomycetota bacterium]
MVSSWCVREVRNIVVAVCLFFFGIASSSLAGQEMLDFSDCVIVAPGSLSKVEQKAVAVLQEEIQKRTGITPQTTKNWPQD